jgi:hypothetical protein
MLSSIKLFRDEPTQIDVGNALLRHVVPPAQAYR